MLATDTQSVEQLDTCAACGRDPGGQFYFVEGRHYCLTCKPQGHIPCTDYSCTREHRTLRTGPVFASFHNTDEQS